MDASFDIVVISPEYKRDDEALVLLQLFELGLEYFHLRKPKWAIAEMEELLNSVPDVFCKRIVLHSHFELAGKYPVKGIHLSEKNRKEYILSGNEQIISTSFHSLDEIRENTFAYPYVFLGPVFDSISKPGYRSKFNLMELTDGLSLLKQENRSSKIIGLGGINRENISEVESAGFSGAALLGAIWESDNPVEAYLAISATI